MRGSNFYQMKKSLKDTKNHCFWKDLSNHLLRAPARRVRQLRRISQEETANPHRQGRTSLKRWISEAWASFWASVKHNPSVKRLDGSKSDRHPAASFSLWTFKAQITHAGSARRNSGWRRTTLKVAISWLRGGEKVFVDLVMIGKGSRQREEAVMINMLLNKCVWRCTCIVHNARVIWYDKLIWEYFPNLLSLVYSTGKETEAKPGIRQSNLPLNFTKPWKGTTKT